MKITKEISGIINIKEGDSMKKLLVIGSINMDVIMKVDSMPKPGESTLCPNIITAPGGKGANQAVAASRLGCPTTFIGKLGNDEYGKKLLNNLKENNVDISFTTTQGDQTGIAYIILESNGQNRIIISSGANMSFSSDDLDIVKNIISDYDMVLLQLEIPLDIVSDIIKIAKSHGKVVIVDAGPAMACDIRIFQGVDILSPNETEAEKLTGVIINNIEDAIKAGRILLENGIEKVVLKMGSTGALYIDNAGYVLIPSYKVPVVDTTAAGDAFTAAMATRLLMGEDIITAIKYANTVGALTVTKLGAQPSLPFKEEIEKWNFN